MAVAEGQQPGRGKDLTKNDLYKLWLDLGSADAEIAFHALETLAAAEERSVEYLKPRLKPRPGEKADRFDQLIQDLDSKDDETRDIARQELEKLGELAVPPLQSALAGRPSDKLRSGVEGLLGKLEKAGLSAEQLRTSRAIEVLERVGSQQARGILETLATGAPAARVTREAEAALLRLKKRSGAL